MITYDFFMNYLDPPSVEIVSLPVDPVEAQSVTLSCLAHGGYPSDNLKFSWWYTPQFRIPEFPLSKPVSELNSIISKALVSAWNSSLFADVFVNMERISEHTGRHFMLDNVDKTHVGWYGCEVTNSGGTSRNLHLFLIDCKLNHDYLKYLKCFRLNIDFGLFDKIKGIL